MKQSELFPINSPCVGICIANNKGYCQACFRSRRERQAWHSLNSNDKRNVLRLCSRRYKKSLSQNNKNNENNLLLKQINFKF